MSLKNLVLFLLNNNLVKLPIFLNFREVDSAMEDGYYYYDVEYDPSIPFTEETLSDTQLRSITFSEYGIRIKKVGNKYTTDNAKLSILLFQVLKENKDLVLSINLSNVTHHISKVDGVVNEFDTSEAQPSVMCDLFSLQTFVSFSLLDTTSNVCVVISK